MLPYSSLADAIGFTQDDLAINRVGRLSATQIENLSRKVRRNLPGCLVVTLFFTLFWGVFVAGFTRQIIAGVIVGLIVFVLSMALTILSQNQSSRALERGEVQSVSGIVSRKYTPGGQNTFEKFEIIIDNARFTVDDDVYNAFQEGAAYQVYYVKLNVRTIVSAHPLA